MPHCPYFLNWNGLGISGPGWPWRTTTRRPCRSSGCPAYFVQRGLGIERVDVADAAAHEQRDHALRARREMRLLRRVRVVPGAPSRRTRHCGSPASRPSWFSRYASARPLTPPPDRNRKSRLDQKFAVCFMAAHLHVHELVQVQQHVREVGERSRFAQNSSADRAAPSGVGGRVSAIRYARSICCAGSFAAAFLHAIREQLRLPQHELVVEQRQRLRRHRRHVARAAD